MKQEKLFPLALALLALTGLPRLPAQTAASFLDEFADDRFDAVQTLSTQARYTQGLFTSDVDDYIDVNAYDPDIGTFFFLGASPVGATVSATTPVTGISFGFAKTLRNAYLGLYFGGTFLGANGSATTGGTKVTQRTAAWDARLAILYGTGALGGLRLDITLDGTDIKNKSGGDLTSGSTKSAAIVDGAIIAASWGKNLNSALAAHFKAGFRFPDYDYSAAKTTTWSDALWGVNGGLSSALNGVSTLEAGLTLGGNFGQSVTPDGGSKTTEPGNFGLVVDAALVNIFVPVSGLELGLKPYAGLGFKADPSDVGNSSNRFELALGLDFGLKARLPGKLNKFSLVTGAGINIFDWYTRDNTDANTSSWMIDGIGWKTETLSAHNNGLGVGLVFDPNQNFSVGLGINALLDGLFILDLRNMRVRPGTFFTSAAGGSILHGLFDTSSNVNIDLTVSCKF
jgi:hypothetical protein